MPHNLTHRGFTLIEIILVVVILGILMTIGSSLFVATDNSTYYAETCANHLYGAIKNYQYGALVGKDLNLGVEGGDLTAYIIKFDTQSNSIDLQYASDDEVISYQTISLSGSNPQRLCYSQSYIIRISGSFDTLSLHMAKNFSQYDQNPAIKLTKTLNGNDTDVATGTITLIQESLIDNTSKEISQIHIDTRNQNITHHDCYEFNRANGTCNSRQQ